MDIKTIMDELAERLRTIDGLAARTHATPPKTVTPPAAILTYPDTITYDATYGRGEDRMTIGIWMAVGDVTSKTARDLLSDYTAGSGPKSVKEVLESGEYTGFDVVTVTQAEFDPITIGAITYMGAMFTLDIAGSGS